MSRNTKDPGKHGDQSECFSANRYSRSKLKDVDLEPSLVRVFIHGNFVGTLAQAARGTLAFQYEKSWLDTGFSLSPFSLPLESRVFVAKPHPLDGVFGIFGDSLPDGWGRLLVDRTLREYGIDPFSVSSLARLAIVGKSGMGALEYEPEVSLFAESALGNLDEIAVECEKMLTTDYSEDLDTLFALGGSSGGARPKILTSIDGDDWIVKFPSSYDHLDIGYEEYTLALAAGTCGIEMSEVRLLPSNRCSGYFAIKRFDRKRDQGGIVKKVHMASIGALLETSHRTPNLDYDLLTRLTLRLTDSMEEVERLYRLMTFNVLVGNRDDHAKNFTFLYDNASGAWGLSPAYDLTRNSGMNGEHATTVNGKGTAITRQDIIEVGLKSGLTPRVARLVYSEVEEVTHDALAKLMH